MNRISGLTQTIEDLHHRKQTPGREKYLKECEIALEILKLEKRLWILRNAQFIADCYFRNGSMRIAKPLKISYITLYDCPQKLTPNRDMYIEGEVIRTDSEVQNIWNVFYEAERLARVAYDYEHEEI